MTVAAHTSGPEVFVVFGLVRWWHRPLTSALREERQEELEASSVYIMSFRPARIAQ